MLYWVLNTPLQSNQNVKMYHKLQNYMTFFKAVNVTEKNLSQICVMELLAKIVRSSHRRCSMKKGVLESFAKFRGKHLCQSLFFNKVAGLMQLY